MSKLVEFISEFSTDAAQYVLEMEKVLYLDPSSSVVKARKFAETIVNHVYEIEEIDGAYLSFYERISKIARDGTIKREIQKSFDTIRISGNKAAHPGQYNDLAEAIKLHKEIYNIAVWYYELYISEEIKVPLYNTPNPRDENHIENMVVQTLKDLLGNQNINLTNTDFNKKNDTGTDQIIQPDNEMNTDDTVEIKLPEGEGYLHREVQKLRESSKEAVENVNDFSHFKKYLHVERKIQLDLEEILEKNNSNSSSLILLCGNVGDGKSHLLAYLQENKKELLSGFKIHNDATESFSPEKTALETLTEVLKGFSDQKIEESDDQVILAINMGVLHNFITHKHEDYSYSKLKDFIERSGLFSEEVITQYNDDHFNLLSFGDYHSFEITSKGPVSEFYSTILKKVTSATEKNSFYLAFKADEKNKINSMVHENFMLLRNEDVQDVIVQLIIQSIVKKKLIISARAFLNFIADILLPDIVQQTEVMSEFDVLENSLPSLLFNRVERSDILKAVNELDPIHYRTVEVDNLIIQLNTLDNWNKIIYENIQDKTPINWLKPITSNEIPQEHSFDLIIECFVRSTYLTNKKFARIITDSSYSRYIKNLYYFNVRNVKYIKRFYEEIRSVILKWKGSPKKDYVYLNKPSEKYRLAQQVDFKPSIDHLRDRNDETIDTFKPFIPIVYKNRNKKEEILLEVDYPLYRLLSDVRDGYRPNKKNEEDAIKFVEFIDKIMAFGNKKDEILICFTTENRFYSISKDDFGAFVFEKENA